MSEESSLHSKRKTKKGGCFWIIPILVLLVVVIALWVFERWQESPQNLYADAAAATVTAEAEEIESLVALSRSNELTTGDEQGRVLLLS